MSRASFTVECGEIEYEITLDSFTPGTGPTRDHPGDGPEAELPATAKIFARGVEVGVTTWNVVLIDFAYHQQITLQQADDKLTQLAITAGEEWHGDRLEDRSGWREEEE